ncbi:MAG: hypothetical protein RMJ59_02170 [Candidatus Nitrosocaldus sp.]|nr:hypothetical protein [Candidatus Nitrosocaldus sp.]MDW8001009.1 hypothetical protein [Candidatus Nitrosocaldus sp.]MDW8275173.1 hypothetical protein [Candidatus Nitrosocaldus sp.]
MIIEEAKKKNNNRSKTLLKDVIKILQNQLKLEIELSRIGNDARQERLNALLKEVMESCRHNEQID